MTITPHILAGAALASFLPTGSVPIRLIGFALGFTSHYVLDAIPHWERLYGIHYNDELVGAYSNWPRYVTFQALADTFIGCAAFFTILIFIVPDQSRATVFWGGAGAALPDLMDSVPWWSEYTKRLPVWRYLTRLHDWVHSDYDLQRKLPLFLGIASQAAVIIAALLILMLG